MVDDACSPPWNQMAVEVEFATAPKLVVVVNENAPPAPVASVPQTMLPDASVSSASLQEMREETVNPPDVTLNPRIVDDAVPDVVSIAVADSPAANVDVAAVPCTTRNPDVVAPPEMVRPVVCVAPPIVDEAYALKESAPMSMVPNPLVMLPEFSAPVVTRLASASIADSKVVSVVASIASMLLSDAVSPPERMLVVPSRMSPPDTVRSPVVVAPPHMVRPVVCPPAPIVDDAFEKSPAKVTLEVVSTFWSIS